MRSLKKNFIFREISEEKFNYTLARKNPLMFWKNITWRSILKEKKLVISMGLFTSYDHYIINVFIHLRKSEIYFFFW
jgi:hypothetical protein